nr:hypothetical protein [Tanacetum cinerariifolium]
MTCTYIVRDQQLKMPSLIEEEVKQNGLLHEEKGKEATWGNDGQMFLSNSICKKDEDEEKEQDVNVLEKDQSDDGVTSIQDLMPEERLEETKHQSNCNEAEVKAKESMEKETEETIFSVRTQKNIKAQSLNNVIPTDSSITLLMKPEETMPNEQNTESKVGLKET